MDSDLFIACQPGLQLHCRKSLRAKIDELGNWFQFQPHLYYLATPYKGVDVFNSLKAAIGGATKFAVVDFSADPACVIGDWSDIPIEKVNSIWSQMQGRTQSFASAFPHLPMQSGAMQMAMTK